MHPIALLFVTTLVQPTNKPQTTPPPAAPAVPPKAEPANDSAKPLVAFPNPLITEVLYNVPTGDNGDANKDGTRQVAGDEFVELVNPHDRPIDLRGYTISDMTAQEKTAGGKPKSNAIRWTFPPLTLKPGEVVVVFNGNASAIPGAVGDSSTAAKKNDKFNDAYVFTMRQPTDKIGFANTADWVMLTGPDGKPVQLIKWGEPRVKVPEGVPLVEEAPSARNASVQRTAANGPLAAHPADGKSAFSPGLFVMPTPPEKEAKKPDLQPPPAKPDAAKPETKPAEPSPAEPKPSETPKKPKY
ncbi:MAG: lamin tail domain-containing protein [Phycisphaerales bacterium]